MAKLVLVVDDDQDQRRLLERVLGGMGYRVLTAVDGDSALSTARASRPDLILLDVMMPGLNGFQACRQFKGDAALREIPVVILTTKDQAADEFWAAEVGADRFLHKPLDVAGLQSTLAELLGTS